MSALDEWKAAGEAGDAARALDALTVDAELVSPLTSVFAFRGPLEIGPLLVAVFDVVSNYRYRADVRAGSEAFLSATLVVRGVEVHEFQHLELDDAGSIRRITIAMRPLVAATAFARALGPALAVEQGRPRRARILRPAAALLDSVARTGDAKVFPLAAP